MSSQIVSLDQQHQRVQFNAFELANEMVFSYFNRLPVKDRDEALLKAISIGVLALIEDRLAAFLAKTQNELGLELEHLKIIFDMKKEIFFKTAVKGLAAEQEIVAFLDDYIARRQLNDQIQFTGVTPGAIPGNKTGDIVCVVNNNAAQIIAVEVKFDRSLKLGDIQDHNIFTRKSDTVWSQLIEAQANRQARAGIIVFDTALVDTSITNIIDGVGFMPGVGFVAIVDSQRGDYTNLAIAYNLARNIVANAKNFDDRDATFTCIVRRVIKDINSLLSIQTYVDAIIKNSENIMQELQRHYLSMRFSLEYLEKFMQDGQLSKPDLLAFYAGEDVKRKFEALDVNDFFDQAKS
ncbi:MAG: hypothetical protein JW953_22565 [Anaerolineae bacterium]|nr:hypothetical protein [Anaerolineae bacterium]